MALINGSDAVWDDGLSFQVVNKIKNHWYGATPPTDPQDGMIWVKNDGSSYFYHDSAWYPIGKVAQIITDTYSTVATKSTGFPNDDSKPQITEGDEILSCAITPKNANSIILIFYNIHMRHVTTFCIACLFRSGTNDALQLSFAYNMGQATMYFELANNTNVRTYSVRVGDSTGNNCIINDTYFSKFGTTEICQLIVMEVLP